MMFWRRYLVHHAPLHGDDRPSALAVRAADILDRQFQRLPQVVEPEDDDILGSIGNEQQRQRWCIWAEQGAGA